MRYTPEKRAEIHRATVERFTKKVDRLKEQLTAKDAEIGRLKELALLRHDAVQLYMSELEKHEAFVAAFDAWFKNPTDPHLILLMQEARAALTKLTHDN